MGKSGKGQSRNGNTSTRQQSEAARREVAETWQTQEPAEKPRCWICHEVLMVGVADSKGRKVHVPCKRWAEMGYASMRDIQDLPPLGIDEIQRARNEQADNSPAQQPRD